MIRRPPRSTRTDTLFPYTTLFRSDRAVIDHPTYHNAIQALQRAHVVPVPVGLPAQGWDIDAMEAAFRQTSPRFAYIIADFHNPTGRSMDPGTRRALVAAATRSHIDRKSTRLNSSH